MNHVNTLNSTNQTPRRPPPPPRARNLHWTNKAPLELNVRKKSAASAVPLELTVRKTRAATSTAPLELTVRKTPRAARRKASVRTPPLRPSLRTRAAQPARGATSPPSSTAATAALRTLEECFA
jgi:hypothetical protein